MSCVNEFSERIHLTECHSINDNLFVVCRPTQNKRQTKIKSSERESSDSSANQISSVQKRGDAFFRSQRCPEAVTKHQSSSKDNSELLMLKLEVSNLRETCLKEFSEIKALIMAQNNVAVKEKQSLRSIIENGEGMQYQFPVWEFDRIFPINSEDQLNLLNSIDEEHKMAAISTVRQLIYNGGFCANMKRIFGTRIIVNYNYEGKSGKKSLKEFTNVNEILFRAAFKPGYTLADYETDLRKGFKIMKNRFFKNECVKRKKIGINPEQTNLINYSHILE